MFNNDDIQYDDNRENNNDKLDFIYTEPKDFVIPSDYSYVDEDVILNNTDEENEYYENLKKPKKKRKKKPKSKFLNLALDVLGGYRKNVGLTVNEIWRKRNRNFKTNGKTPPKTLSCALHKNLRSENSYFKKKGTRFFLK